MNSNRNLTQVYIEKLMNFKGQGDWTSYKQKLESRIFTSDEINKIKNSCKDDSYSYYIKGITSLFYGLENIAKKQFSWATVKFYYSLFYFLRSEILLSENVLVRCKSFLYFHIGKMTTFKKYSPKKIRGDHQFAIHFHKFLHDNAVLDDPLLNNKISDDNLYVYNWYLLQRENINYRQKNFTDPLPNDIFLNYNRLSELIDEFINDKDYIYCFDEEYAGLAIPITKAYILKQKFNSENKKYPLNHLNRISKLIKSSSINSLLT